MKKLIPIEAALFVLVSVISTYRAAKVDEGTYAALRLGNSAVHKLSFAEAFTHDIPLGIFEGLLAIAVTLMLAYAVKFGLQIRKELQDAKITSEFIFKKEENM